MSTAVEQIKQFYASLSTDAKTQFLKQNNLTADLMESWIINPKLAESLCNKYIAKDSSNTNSTWDLYKKGQQAYATATVQYNQDKAIYNALKHKQEVAQTKYEKLVAEELNQKSQDEGLSINERSSLASKSGYTTELIKTTKEAEWAMDRDLDARRMAVNTQRRGLNCMG